MSDAAARRKRSRERKAQQTSAAIRQRVVDEQTKKRQELSSHAASLADDSLALKEREAAIRDSDLSRQQQRALERERRKLEERHLRLLERDEDYVRSALQRREKLQGIMAADTTTDGDELLWFIAEELSLLPLFEQLTPPLTRVNKAGKEVKCRLMYPPLLLNLLGLLSYDRYDERSLIENRLNRDGKQHFGLGQSLARNPEALLSATLFSTLALTLFRALEIHRDKASEESERRCEPLGVLRYRRQLAMTNRNCVIVVVHDRYGILPLRQFASLLGAAFL